MRSTQYMGIPDEAEKFIRNNIKRSPSKICSECGHNSGGQELSEIYDSAADQGMFDDGPNLYRYTMKDGTTWIEKVQAVPWSSGPCIFLMLVQENGPGEFKWDEESINNC